MTISTCRPAYRAMTSSRSTASDIAVKSCSDGFSKLCWSLARTSELIDLPFALAAWSMRCFRSAGIRSPKGVMSLLMTTQCSENPLTAIATPCSLCSVSSSQLAWNSEGQYGGKMEGARQISPLQVRLPLELREWLKAEAERNRRSLNSEIVARLEASRQLPIALA